MQMSDDLPSSDYAISATHWTDQVISMPYLDIGHLPASDLLSEPSDNEFGDQDYNFGGNEDVYGDQIGGGPRKRYTSPPVETTPSRLRPKPTPSARDGGLVSQAGIHRAQIEPLVIPPASNCGNGDDPFIDAENDSTHPSTGPFNTTSTSFQRVSPLPSQQVTPFAKTTPTPPRHVSPMPSGTMPTSFEHIPAFTDAPSRHLSPFSNAPSRQVSPFADATPTASFRHAVPPDIQDYQTHTVLQYAVPPYTQQDRNYQTHGADTALDKYLDNAGFSPHVPTTRVIPPTPALFQTVDCVPGPDLSRLLPPSDNHAFPVTSATQPYYSPLAVQGPGSPSQAVVTGRISDSNVEAMDACYEEVGRIFAKSAEQTGLSVTQIISGWEKRNKTHTKLGNGWNIYGRYFAQNRVQELRRVFGDIPEGDLPGKSRGATSSGWPIDDFADPVDPDVRSTCYAEFRKAMPDVWQEFLSTWDEVRALGGEGTTIAERGRAFSALCKQITKLVSACLLLHDLIVLNVTAYYPQADAAARRHGFQVVLVAAGNAVNQDASLGNAHVTEGAEGVSATHCQWYCY
jgi:hypothetical protein